MTRAAACRGGTLLRSVEGLSLMTLNELSLHARARIVDVTGDDAIAMRLMEMGLTEDEPVEFLGKAPLGDPLEFLVRGYRISMRQSEAARVIVELLPAIG